MKGTSLICLQQSLGGQAYAIPKKNNIVDTNLGSNKPPESNAHSTLSASRPYLAYPSLIDVE